MPAFVSRRLSALALSIFFFYVLNAQGAYGPWQQIYTDAYSTLSIAFKESGTSCNASGKTNRYKYKIDGALNPTFLTVHSFVSYTDCNGNRQSARQAINLGSGGALGELESGDYVYKGKNARAYTASTDANYNPLGNSQAGSTNEGGSLPSTGNSSGNAGSNSNKWGSWIKLYSDSYASVFICYKMSANSCDQGGLLNKYKFRIDGNLRSYYCDLPVQIQIINCQGRTNTNNHNIPIGSGGTLGEIESIDYRFVGKSVVGQKFTDPGCKPGAPKPSAPPMVVNGKKRKNPASWVLRFATGLDMGTRPMTATYTYGINGLSVTDNQLKVINPFAIGWRGDLEYSPIFVRGFGLAFNVGGAYGVGAATMFKYKPKSIEEPDATTDGSTTYKYYKIDFGAELVFGWEADKNAVLLLGKYQFHFNAHNFTRSTTYTTGNYSTATETLITNPGFRRETIYAGLRIKPHTFNLTMDLTFQLSRDYYWNGADWGYAHQTPFQYGGGLAFSINSRRISRVIFLADVTTGAVYKNASYSYDTSPAREVFSRACVLISIGGSRAYK